MPNERSEDRTVMTEQHRIVGPRAANGYRTATSTCRCGFYCPGVRAPAGRTTWAPAWPMSSSVTPQSATFGATPCDATTSCSRAWRSTNGGCSRTRSPRPSGHQRGRHDGHGALGELRAAARRRDRQRDRGRV